MTDRTQQSSAPKSTGIVRTPEPFWTSQNIQRSIGGRWLNTNEPFSPSQPRPIQREGNPQQAWLSGVCIDSRTIRSGQIFFAVSGERFNGHDFLRQAVDGGAGLLVVSDMAAASRLGTVAVGILLVDDTLQALQDFASAYRVHLRHHGTTVIAVTGSNGKTTTREIIHATLSSKWTGSQSPKSFNNHVGVPLTLLAVRESDQFVVVELGSSRIGEIAKLAKLVKPDVAVITNIGSAHLVGFGSLPAIAAEKSAVLDHLSEGGTAIVPGDEPLLTPYIDRAKTNGVTFMTFGQRESNDLQLDQCQLDEQGLRFTVLNHGRHESDLSAEIRLPLLGRHNAVNAMAAMLVGRASGMDNSTITTAMSNVKGVTMRLDVRRIGPTNDPLVIINDAYNANPDSMLAAVHVLASYPISKHQVPSAQGRRVLVLGDMLDLGAASPSVHDRLGCTIATMKTAAIDMVVIAGEQAAHVANGLNRSDYDGAIHTYASWDTSTCENVAALLKPGDVVLIKASRAVKLEQLVPQIEAVAHTWTATIQT